MTGDQHDIVAILVKYALREPLTEAEEQGLERWRQRSAEHEALPEQFRDRQWLAKQRRQLHPPPTEEMWEDIRRYIDERESESPVVVMRTRRRIGLGWFPVAALLLVAVIYGGMRSWQVRQSSRQVGRAVAPVGFKVLLRLANGNFVRLDTMARGAVLPEGQLRKTDSNSYVYIRGSGAVSRNRLVLAPDAGVTRVQWPDGSSAWMKPGSSLEYATDLRSAEIKVEGEAWLRIAHDPSRPVTVVMADDIRVRVLGTSFAVRSLAGRPGNRVALFSGRVRVVKGIDSTLLRPGSQAEMGGARIKTATVDSNEALTWLRPTVKSPVFEFQDADLLGMMPEIAAWYRVQVMNPLKLRGKAVTGEFLRTMSLPDLIACLKEFEGPSIRMTLREDTIFITPLKLGI